MVPPSIEENLIPIVLSLTSISLAWAWNHRVEKKVEGKREERIRRAHEEIVALVIKNTVQNEIPIGNIDLSYIIGSTLRKYHIANEIFFSKKDLMEDIYTEVMDNEYISADTKNRIQREIEDIMESLESFGHEKILLGNFEASLCKTSSSLQNEHIFSNHLLLSN